jgi:hypothetical protein
MVGLHWLEAPKEVCTVSLLTQIQYHHPGTHLHWTRHSAM